MQTLEIIKKTNILNLFDFQSLVDDYQGSDSVSYFNN